MKATAPQIFAHPGDFKKLRNPIPIFFRCFPYILLENLCEIIDVRNPAVLRDRLNLHTAGIEEEQRVFHPFLVDVIGQCLPGFFFK